MGYSFAAGTTDGPGSFAFEQGTTTSNPFWNTVRNCIAAPTKEDISCHGAKPILLATGRVSKKKTGANKKTITFWDIQGQLFILRHRNISRNKNFLFSRGKGTLQKFTPHLIPGWGGGGIVNLNFLFQTFFSYDAYFLRYFDVSR